MSVKEGLTLNDYTDEAAAAKRGRGIRKCPGCDQPVPAPGHYDHARGCPEDAVAKAEKDAMEKAIREAAARIETHEQDVLRCYEEARSGASALVWGVKRDMLRFAADEVLALLARPEKEKA